MSLDKLRELDAAASPGPWQSIGPVDEEHAKNLEANDAFTCWVYDPKDEVATFDAHELRQNFANAQLAALAHLILPLAEAVERTGNMVHGEFCLSREIRGTDCSASCHHAQDVLTRLEEVLNG